MAEPEERIEHDQARAQAMEAEAPFGELRGKGRGMWTFRGAALDRLVGDEPVVPAAAPVAAHAPRVCPAGDVAFVGVFHADREAIQRHIAGLGEVEDVFVAVGQVALAELIGLKWPTLSSGARRGCTVIDLIQWIVFCRRKSRLQLEHEFVREQRIGRRGADVEEKGSARLEHAPHFSRPLRRTSRGIRARGASSR